MPPKAARGGRAGRGGRGRGRGRGAPEVTPTTAEVAAEALPVGENASTTMTTSESQNASLQNTPMLSPASVPTETPASTPATVPNLAPSQRPDSLAPGRGRGRGRGTPAVGAAPPAFKPKAVRRDQSERQKAAEEERKRIEERNRAAVIAESRSIGRGRGASRGSRARGDAMGKRYPAKTFATGLFSQLPSKLDPKDSRKIADQAITVGSSGYEGFSGGGAATTLAGRPKTKQESISRGDYNMGGTGTSTSGSGGFSDGVRIKKEIPDPVYPGLAEEGQGAGRVNIEEINLASEDEDEEGPLRKGKGRAVEMRRSAGGLKPIRVAREEHQERTTVVNTEASGGPANIKEADIAADDDEDGLFVPQDLEAEKLRRNKAGVVSRDATGKPWAGVWSDTEDDVVPIKPDPDASEAMDIDSVPASVPPKSPSLIEESIVKESPSSKAKLRIRRGSGLRDKNPVLQTDEDKAEWMRHEEDVAILAQELGSLQTAMKPKTPGISDADGDTEMDQEENQVMDKEGRLYLFQFPPIMPSLRNPNHVKKEETEDIDMAQISNKPAPGISGSSTAPIDISKPANPNEARVESIKTEPDTDAGKKESHAAEDIIPEEGFVGKLIVRESGAVELDWGGTDFVLSRGASHDFLMTTLLMDGLDLEDGSEEDASMRHKSAVSMGSVMGKFVVTPDWDKIL